MYLELLKVVLQHVDQVILLSHLLGQPGQLHRRLGRIRELPRSVGDVGGPAHRLLVRALSCGNELFGNKSHDTQHLKGISSGKVSDE